MREGLQRGDISMEFIETQFQLADIFTKALDSAIFIKFRDMLVVPAATLNLVVKKAQERKTTAVSPTPGSAGSVPVGESSSKKKEKR